MIDHINYGIINIEINWEKSMQELLAHNGVEDGHPNEKGAVQDESSTVDTTSKVITTNSTSNADKSNTKPIILTVSIAVILIIVILAVVYMFKKKSKNQTNTIPETPDSNSVSNPS